MKEWFLSVINSPQMISAISGAIGAIIIACATAVGVWIKSKAPSAVVNNLWDYLLPIVRVAWDEGNAALESGSVTSSWQTKLIAALMAELERDYKIGEAKDMTPDEKALAQSELEDVIKRATDA